MSPAGRFTVAITRPLSQAEELARMTSERGWTPLVAPTVEISRAERSPALDGFVRGECDGQRDLCVFTSQNGVAHAFDEAERSGTERMLRQRLGGCTVVAIGPRTAGAVERMGVKVDIVPSKHSSEGILDELARRGFSGGTAYILRSDIGGDELRSGLERMCDRVEDIPVYASHAPLVTTAAKNLIREALAGRVDAITFTSASAAENLFGIALSMGTDKDLLRALNEHAVVAAIGDVTMRALERLGVEVDVVPQVFTLVGMMDALDEHVRAFGRSKNGRPLDRTDREIVDMLQFDFPICQHPFAEIASRLDVDEEEVLRRTERLLASGTVRRIGPVVDRKRMGLAESTLVAFKVPRERVHEVASIINAHPQVSHNYGREHEYNIWFTVAGRDRAGVEATVRDIAKEAGVKETDLLELPSVYMYKIDARLRTV